MFGLRKRIQQIEGKLFHDNFSKQADKAHASILAERNRILEERVLHLEKALAWHVGTSIEIILAEEKIVKLKLEESKQRLAESGDCGTPQEQMEGMRIDGPGTEVE